MPNPTMHIRTKAKWGKFATIAQLAAARLEPRCCAAESATVGAPLSPGREIVAKSSLGDGIPEC